MSKTLFWVFVISVRAAIPRPTTIEPIGDISANPMQKPERRRSAPPGCAKTELRLASDTRRLRPYPGLPDRAYHRPDIMPILRQVFLITIDVLAELVGSRGISVAQILAKLLLILPYVAPILAHVGVRSVSGHQPVHRHPLRSAYLRSQRQ